MMKGLSGGAIAGIVLGLVILVGIVVVAIYRCRRTKYNGNKRIFYHKDTFTKPLAEDFNDYEADKIFCGRPCRKKVEFV